MYKKSKLSTEPTLFSGLSQQVGSKKLSRLEDPKSWHNYFFQELTSKFDEDIFVPLYVENNGRPNASIRQLLGMLILKEGNDWTDEQLFEACNFNILVMRAIGLSNLSDSAPSPATYYNFKLALLEYEKENGINLLELAFSALTKDQIIRYQVSGTAIRMDSKLIQSNIAKMTRLQMSLGIISKFYKSLQEEQKDLLNEKQSEDLIAISTKSPEQYTYKLNKQTANEQLIELGKLVYQLLKLYNDSSSTEYELLERLWADHFELVEQENGTTPKPKNMKDQGGSTLQSAHDPQAAYRNKPGVKQQKITGYVSNITDTCSSTFKEEKEEKEEKELHLITCVQTAAATKSDDKFFESAIESTREVLNDHIESVLTDGAYNSQNNEQKITLDSDISNWYLTAIQGAKGHYDFEQIQQGQYKVTDKRTGLEQITILTPKGKYRIDEHHAKCKYRYFEQTTITNYFRRKAMENYPQWIYGQRANGEATIHQVFCKLNGMKSKYRGLFKNHCYVLSRSFWVNFTRIKDYSNKNNLFIDSFLSFWGWRHFVAAQCTPKLSNFKFHLKQNFILIFQRTFSPIGFL